MEEKKKEWPKVWEHKINKKRLNVMPWWECVEPMVASDTDYGAVDVGKEIADGRKFRIGAIVQIGWLLENEHGVWFGVGPQAEESFIEIKGDT